MTQRDIRAGQHPYTYSVLDYARDELRENPLRLRDVGAFLVGLPLVLALLVLLLAGGPK